MRRVVLAAGGTGGHFYPGLVAALALKDRGWEPLMVVRADDPALARLEAAGVAALPVDLRGLPRRLGPELATFAARLFGGLRLLSRALADFRPSLAVGMGGYLTFPLMWEAARRGVPRAVHESNAMLGLANAAAARLGARVFWGLPPSRGAHGCVVGTPVRPELRAPRAPAEARRALGLDPAKTTVLIVGGSQGARALNARLPAALAQTRGLQILHLAGRGRAEEARAAYARAKQDADVRDYLEDMASAYGAADLVVSRAGASTLAELAALAKPAVLIPYPHAAGGHQDANARVLEEAGAAARAPESGLDADLRVLLAGLLTSADAAQKRAAMSRAYGHLGLPPAEKVVHDFVDKLETLAKK